MSKRVTISVVMGEDVIKLVDRYAKDHTRSRSMSMELLVKQQLSSVYGECHDGKEAGHETD